MVTNNSRDKGRKEEVGGREEGEKNLQIYLATFP